MIAPTFRTLSQSIWPACALLTPLLAGDAAQASNEAPCTDYPAYESGHAYQGGELVGHEGGQYRCKAFPYNGWCGQLGYQPGVDAYWSEAWERVGDCVAAPLPACAEVSAFTPGSNYAALDLSIGDDAAMYQCKGWPYTPFCHQAGFAPGNDSTPWQLAWDVVDSCDEPTGYPFAGDYDGLTQCQLDAGPPDALDWRAQGVVQPVNNTGACGAHWAAAALDSINSVAAIATGSLTSTSIQQVIDCDDSATSCDGRSPIAAMDVVMANGGTCSESEYPYTGSQQTCQASSCGTKYNPITGYCGVPSGDEEALKAAVAAGGVATVVLATGVWYEYYGSGIADPGECGTDYQAAMVVGYGEEGGQPYWLVRADRGAAWGEDGYIRIARGNNTCGIADYVAIATVN